MDVVLALGLVSQHASRKESTHARSFYSILRQSDSPGSTFLAILYCSARFHLGYPAEPLIPFRLSCQNEGTAGSHNPLTGTKGIFTPPFWFHVMALEAGYRNYF